MKHLHRITLVVVLGIISHASVFAQLKLSDDPLWLKAVVIAAMNEDQIPGLWVEKEDVFNKKGKLEESKAYTVKFEQAGDNDIDVTLVKATFNGQDVTEGVGEILEQEKKNQALEDESDNPFSPHVQKNITVTRTDEFREIMGRLCVGFNYEQQTAETMWRGTAWIDTTTGVPMELQSAPDEAPQAEKGVTISDLQVTTLYTFVENGDWYAHKTQLDMDVKAKILPFITFKGTAKTVITLSDYWRYQF